MPLAEFDVVRVRALNVPSRNFDGSKGVMREPRINDIGVIVHVLAEDEMFIVECVDADGYTTWLADFSAEELETFSPDAIC